MEGRTESGFQGWMVPKERGHWFFTKAPRSVSEKERKIKGEPALENVAGRQLR